MELRYVLLLVFVSMSIPIGGYQHRAFASERSLIREHSLILRLDSQKEDSQRDTIIMKDSDLHSSEGTSRREATATQELRLPPMSNPLPVDPWFPGRGSIGVKLEVTW